MSESPPSPPSPPVPPGVEGPAPPLTSGVLAALPGVVHGFTSRAHGSVRRVGSTEPADAIDEALVSLRQDPLAWTRHEPLQVHGATVLDDTKATEQAEEADAVVTCRPGRLAVVRTADCQAVLLAALDAAGAVIGVGAAHAGWRGLLAGVLPATIAALPARAERIVAALGPAIGPCCFEVGPEVSARFAERHGESVVVRRGGARAHVDLPGAVRAELAAEGVVVDAAAAPCTRCEPHAWHSHRATGGRAGRLGAFIGTTGTTGTTGDAAP